MVSGCNRELNAHFYSAVSLKYYAQDTLHDITPCQIILILDRPVLALRLSLRAYICSTIFDFGVSRPGIEPVTSCSLEWTKLLGWVPIKVIDCYMSTNVFPLRGGLKLYERYVAGLEDRTPTSRIPARQYSQLT